MAKCAFMLYSLYFAGFGDSCNPVAKKRNKTKPQSIDKDSSHAHTKAMLQLSGNKGQPEILPTLVDLGRGDAAVLQGIDLPTDEARRLMELGFLPGTRITAGRSAPGGDPRVFQVDGSEIALRRETARHLTVRVERKKKA
jgi:ferrous iron transport protein A